jgi:hypothetical protein
LVLSVVAVDLARGGAQCSIRREGDSYLFANDQGSRARFKFTGREQLEQVEGQWDPAVVCTVTRDNQGRTAFSGSP